MFVSICARNMPTSRDGWETQTKPQFLSYVGQHYNSHKRETISTSLETITKTDHHCNPFSSDRWEESETICYYKKKYSSKRNKHPVELHSHVMKRVHNRTQDQMADRSLGHKNMCSSTEKSNTGFRCSQGSLNMGSRNSKLLIQTHASWQYQKTWPLSYSFFICQLTNQRWKCWQQWLVKSVTLLQ